MFLFLDTIQQYENMEVSIFAKQSTLGVSDFFKQNMLTNM